MQPKHRNMRSILHGLARVHLWRLNNEDDNNDDNIFASYLVVSGRKCILFLLFCVFWGYEEAAEEPSKLHYVNLKEPRLTDRRASGVLLQTMFIKDIWDNFHTNVAQITWGNALTQSEYWRALADKTEELRCHGEHLIHTLFYCAHHHTHFYGE